MVDCVIVSRVSLYRVSPGLVPHVPWDRHQAPDTLLRHIGQMLQKIDGSVNDWLRLPSCETRTVFILSEAHAVHQTENANVSLSKHLSFQSTVSGSFRLFFPKAVKLESF